MIEIELVTINYIFHRFNNIILAVPSAADKSVEWRTRTVWISLVRSCWQTFASASQLKNREWTEWTNRFMHVCDVAGGRSGLVLSFLAKSPTWNGRRRRWRRRKRNRAISRRYRIISCCCCEAINIEIANTFETDTRTHAWRREQRRATEERSKLRT